MKEEIKKSMKYPEETEEYWKQRVLPASVRDFPWLASLCLWLHSLIIRSQR
jgi:hypothetical protein